jgi:predicted transcriptional regulator
VFKKTKQIMTTISSKEFITNQKKYFDLAVNEEVFIKRGKNVFHLICANGSETSAYEEVLQPDDDFRRAISLDELQRRVKEDIHQWYRERNENNSITRSSAIS